MLAKLVNLPSIINANAFKKVVAAFQGAQLAPVYA